MNHMNDDVELLRRYVEEQSQVAFTELVNRRIGLVYQTALRRVGGDVHLAEDVAQRVFTALARKARSLRHHATLTGWLLVSTRYAAAEVVRAEQRRSKWETRAMSDQPETESPSTASELHPVLGEALLELRDEDRDALALRFFEQRSFAEIGRVLRTSEDAARKRVDRALDKLREGVGRRGITSSAAALGIALAGFGAVSAPTRLAASVASHALAQAGAGVSAAGLASAAWHALPIVAVVVGGGWLVLSQYAATQKLQSELDARHAATATIPALRADNERLAARARESEDLRRAVGTAEAATRKSAESAVTTADRPARPVLARVRITPQVTIEWNGAPVTLADFIAHLSSSAKDSRAANDRLVVRAVGTPFSALSYVIEEARKAGIPHLVIESDSKPDSRTAIPNWF